MPQALQLSYLGPSLFPSLNGQNAGTAVDESEAVVNASRSLHELQFDEQAESTRPLKRRRITEEESSNPQTLKDKLISDVYSLLGSQRAADLGGLHSVAE